MTFLTQTDHLVITFPKKRPDPNEIVQNECGRLIHAAVINKRFQQQLLSNPLKAIEDGYCGEKFAFTRDEKRRIQQIQAKNLAEFSRQLIGAIEHTATVPAQTPELAYAW